MGKFLVNLEESETFLRGEVPCIIDLDRNKHPFISEVLPLEQNELTTDELKLLYLSKSTERITEEDSQLLEQLLQKVKKPEGPRQRLLAVEEDPLWQSSPEDTLDCFAKKYKPMALKVRPVLRTLPERFRITREIIDDPLKDMPELPEWPPEFQPREVQSRVEKQVRRVTPARIPMARGTVTNALAGGQTESSLHMGRQ